MDACTRAFNTCRRGHATVDAKVHTDHGSEGRLGRSMDTGEQIYPATRAA